MEPPTDYYQSSQCHDEWGHGPRHHQHSYSRQREHHHEASYDMDQQQSSQQQHGGHHQQHQAQQQQQQSSSRGRSSTSRSTSRYRDQISAVNSQDTLPATGGRGGNNDIGQRRPQLSSSSSTPQRKGNPQSSSPSLDASPGRQQRAQQEQQQHEQQEHEQHLRRMGSRSRSPSRSAGGGGGGGPSSSSCGPSHDNPLTPLSTISTIITAHSLHSRTATQLYRQSHALHRNASDRTAAALRRLGEAQAEVEHATTAQEFAREELERAAARKADARDALTAMCKRVRSLSGGVTNRTVRLVGLSKNAGWNGRRGVVVKLVTDGEDCGRWKVKLDPDWRGRDAGGKIVHGNETISEESEGQQQQQGSSMNVVVAKAENLELVEDDVPCQDDENSLCRDRSTSRSRSASERRGHQQQQRHPAEGQPQQQQPRPQQPRSNSRDPEQEHPSPQRRSQRDPSMSPRKNPVAVTPENRGTRAHYKNITPTNYYKSESGHYHESGGRPSNNHSQQHVHHQSQQHQLHYQSQHASKQSRQSSPPKQPRHVTPSRQASPSKRNQPSPPRKSKSVPRQQRLSPLKNSPARSSKSSSEQYPTTIRRSPSSDSARLSSAFSRMLLSPVSFTPVSFEPNPSENFQSWVDEAETDEQGDDDQFRKKPSQQSQHAQQRPFNDSPGDVSMAGSLFDEITSTDRGVFRVEEFDEGNTPGNLDEWGNPRNNWRNNTSAGDPLLQMYPSVDENGRSLPNIVVLPVPEDDYDNPFLSPGYLSSTPPHCVGVQNAGVSHVNGVYLLAYPKDEKGERIVGDDADNGEVDETTPPLYFKDGPATLLSDDRYYDMCILRIDCPDSADHVIWFLARVDIDPSCLDVKFSDCYYYCRMLRNDDGQGGEQEGGCKFPPSGGWNVPKLPPGVETLPIAPSGSFSTNTATETMTSSQAQRQGQYGLGIHPRPPGVLVARSSAGGGKEVDEDHGDFVSPGVDSSKFSGESSKFSKYSI